MKPRNGSGFRSNCSHKRYETPKQPDLAGHHQMNKMQLPHDVEFQEDVRLLVYRPHGLMNEASVNKVVEIIGDLETALKEPFNRFFDTLGHDEVELNFRYVIQISLHRVLSYLDRPPVKSAILATNNTIIHYCQLHAIITEDSTIKVRIFQRRQDAAQWLGVPVQRLAAKSPTGEDQCEKQFEAKDETST